MNALRIGSLCSGVGALDLAVMDALPGAEVAWHAQFEPPDKDGKPDANQYAAQILAYRWPGVPNHGDITTIDWDTVEPVDILTAGWPCQDMSLAGLGAGLIPGTRSGLWYHVAASIAALRPSLVILENVRSLTSAKAHSDVEFCPWCMGDPGEDGSPVPALRALGAVLGDLADLGFDAEWLCLPAAAVGAPHLRWRAFVLAWPSSDAGRHPWPEDDPHGFASAGSRRGAVPSVAIGVGSNADGHGWDQRRPEPAQPGRQFAVALGGDTAAADAQGVGTGEPADEALTLTGSRAARPVLGGRGLHAAADTDGLRRERPRRPRHGGG